MKSPNAIRDRIAEGVIAVAIAAGAWFIVALPAHDRADAALQERDAAQAELDACNESPPPDPIRLGEVRRTLDSWNASAADPLQAGHRLQQAADDAGVRIDRLTPADSPDVAIRGPIRQTTRRYDMVASGPAPNMARMLDLISESPLAAVRAFELAPGPGADQVIGIVAVELMQVSPAELASDDAIKEAHR